MLAFASCSATPTVYNLLIYALLCTVDLVKLMMIMCYQNVKFVQVFGGKLFVTQ